MKSKNALQKIMNRTKKFSKKLNKTIKNKSALKKCENFCKNDFLIKMNNILKNSAKKYGNPYKSPTKEDNEFAYNTCKKSFCNEKCDGYDFFGNKQQQLEFKKKIKNGFQKGYSKDRVEMLKKRGALSGCAEIDEI